MKKVVIILTVAGVLIISPAFCILDPGFSGGSYIGLGVGGYDGEIQYASNYFVLGINGAVRLAENGNLDDAIAAIDYSMAFLDLQEAALSTNNDPLSVDSNPYDTSEARDSIAAMRESLERFKQMFENARTAGVSIEVSSSEDSSEVRMSFGDNGDNYVVFDSETGLLKDVEVAHV